MIGQEKSLVPRSTFSPHAGPIQSTSGLANVVFLVDLDYGGA